MTVDKKIEENITSYLHEELIFNILVRLPGEVLHNSMRYVCRRWRNMIDDPHFIEAHLLQANTGLVIPYFDSPYHAHFFEIKDGELRLTVMKRQFPGKMVASCEGVSLFSDPNDCRALYVANPIIMQVVAIPPLNLPPFPLRYRCCISRVQPTGEYKVVHSYESPRRVYLWVVLTVGIDSAWRTIGIQLVLDNVHIDLSSRPISVRGVIYYIEFTFELNGCSHFLALDMNDETFHRVPIPCGSSAPCAYLKMRNFLSCFTVNLPTSQFEVYVLKDLCRGEWAKVFEIDVINGSGIPCNPLLVLPIAWLNHDQILIVEALTCHGILHLLYDVETEKTRIVDIDFNDQDIGQVHINSLVSWRKL